MMEAGRDRLAEVVGAIADGTPVDWTKERLESGAELHGALEDLSILERIGQVYASASPEGASTSTRTHAGEPARTPPITSWGRLRILELMGEGGWGEVYRAYDPTLQIEVALKLLKPDEPGGIPVDRFLSEARRLARVRHRNVVTIHGADTYDGRHGIWTELIRGKTLERLVREQGALSAREAALIGIDLCHALAAVHGAGLVHRDVKAGNVMREDGGRTVLMDFGSGAELRPPADLRSSAHVHGTPLTMAPEQLRGEIAGPATDIYGLGALLYWLATRQYPIDASSFDEVARRHRDRQYVHLRDRRADLPAAFVQVVERAVAAEPEKRYATAGEMEMALAGILPKLPTAGWGSRISRSRFMRTPRARMLSVAGAVALVALAAWGIDRLDLGGRDGAESQTPTPSPSAPPTQPPRPRVALTANAYLRKAGSRGEEPLTAGSRVSPGDRLSMYVEGPDSMYVYVLNEDRKGNIFVLFPIPGLEPANPLAPSAPNRLPGQLGDSLVYWEVTNAGEREAIFTVASRSPLKELEDAIRHFPRASRDRPVMPNRVGPEVVRTLRGLGGISVEAPAPGSTSRPLLTDAIRALEERRRHTGDIWIWTAELENPAPKP